MLKLPCKAVWRRYYHLRRQPATVAVGMKEFRVGRLGVVGGPERPCLCVCARAYKDLSSAFGSFASCYFTGLDVWPVLHVGLRCSHDG